MNEKELYTADLKFRVVPGATNGIFQGNLQNAYNELIAQDCRIKKIDFCSDGSGYGAIIMYTEYHEPKLTVLE